MRNFPSFQSNHLETYAQPQGIYITDYTYDRLLVDFYNVPGGSWSSQMGQCVYFNPLSLTRSAQKLSLVVQASSTYALGLYSFVVQIGSTCYNFAADSTSWPYICYGQRELFPAKWIAPSIDGSCNYATMDINLPQYTNIASICIGANYEFTSYYPITFTGQIELSGIYTSTSPATNYQILQQCTLSDNVGTGYVKLIEKTDTKLRFDINVFVTPYQSQCITMQPLRLVGNSQILQLGFLSIDKNDITGLEIVFPESNECYGGGSFAPRQPKYFSGTRCLRSLGNYPKVWERGYLDPTCYSDAKSYNSSSFITAGVTKMCIYNANSNSAAAATTGTGFAFRGQILLTGVTTSSSAEVNYVSTNTCQFVTSSSGGGDGGGGGGTITITNTSNTSTSYHSSMFSSVQLTVIIALLVIILVLLSLLFLRFVFPATHSCWKFLHTYFPYCSAPTTTIEPTTTTVNKVEEDGQTTILPSEVLTKPLHTTTTTTTWTMRFCTVLSIAGQSMIVFCYWLGRGFIAWAKNAWIVTSACCLSVCCGIVSHRKIAVMTDYDETNIRGSQYQVKEQEEDEEQDGLEFVKSLEEGLEKGRTITSKTKQKTLHTKEDEGLFSDLHHIVELDQEQEEERGRRQYVKDIPSAPPASHNRQLEEEQQQQHHSIPAAMISNKEPSMSLLPASNPLVPVAEQHPPLTILQPQQPPPPQQQQSYPYPSLPYVASPYYGFGINPTMPMPMNMPIMSNDITGMTSGGGGGGGYPMPYAQMMALSQHQQQQQQHQMLLQQLQQQQQQWQLHFQQQPQQQPQQPQQSLLPPQMTSTQPQPMMIPTMTSSAPVAVPVPAVSVPVPVPVSVLTAPMVVPSPATHGIGAISPRQVPTITSTETVLSLPAVSAPAPTVVEQIIKPFVEPQTQTQAHKLITQEEVTRNTINHRRSVETNEDQKAAVTITTTSNTVTTAHPVAINSMVMPVQAEEVLQEQEEEELPSSSQVVPQTYIGNLISHAIQRRVTSSSDMHITSKR